MITIDKSFEGGNIQLLSVNGNEYTVEREIRGDKGYFYWAFCVKNAGGKRLRFTFPCSTRVGRFGAAVSHDLKNWRWSNTKLVINHADAFEYSFEEGENCVYFAHNMVYSTEMLNDFVRANGITTEPFVTSRKGREIPCFSVGEGEKMIVLTSRHHACESPGTYVLQAFVEAFLKNPISGVKLFCIPFVDYDGVVDGDPGKNRLPHDHNRDYIDQPIYPEIAKLKELADSENVMVHFDFHAPHHDGGINDHPYIMEFTKEKDERFNEFSALFREYTFSDGQSLKYSGNENIKYGAQWNEENKPNARGYFLDRTILKTSIVLETCYFGVDGNAFSQSKLIRMGNHMYNAFAKIYFQK